MYILHVTHWMCLEWISCVMCIAHCIYCIAHCIYWMCHEWISLPIISHECDTLDVSQMNRVCILYCLLYIPYYTLDVSRMNLDNTYMKVYTYVNLTFFIPWVWQTEWVTNESRVYYVLGYIHCIPMRPVCTTFIVFLWDLYLLQGGEDSQDALICMLISAKEPLIIWFFCGK